MIYSVYVNNSDCHFLLEICPPTLLIQMTFKNIDNRSDGNESLGKIQIPLVHK